MGQAGPSGSPPGTRWTPPPLAGIPVAGILDELYLHVSNPGDEDDQVRAARALVDALSWSASLCHNLRYPDLAQIASRAPMDAAKLISDPVRLGMAQFERIGTAPRAWEHTLVMAERAANALEPHAHDERALQVLGMLTLQCALAATAAHKGALAVHWLTEAEKLATRVNDEDPARNWEWFGATNVAIWRTALAVEHGETRRGHPACRAVPGHRPGTGAGSENAGRRRAMAAAR